MGKRRRQSEMDRHTEREGRGRLSTLKLGAVCQMGKIKKF